MKMFTILGFMAATMLISCKKGSTGPAGTANVRVYHWNSKTTTTGTTQIVDYILSNERYSQIDSIEWHFYVSNDTITNPRDWYQLPGTFDGGEDYFRVFTRTPDFAVDGFLSFRIERIARLSNNPAKTTAITFPQAKAILIPAGIFTNLRTTEPINWNDYNDVRAKLHLKEEDEIEVK